MCGIVGYTGTGDAIHPVIEGLTRLEYRGYDSAGISIFTALNQPIQLFKKEGKLDNLKQILSQASPTGKTAIGHTRWATHGRVNDTNAHPHSNEYFSIVHNGIIENAFTLKEELKKEGHQFLTETDSEVFLALLTKHYRQGLSITQAITSVFTKLHGSSAFVIMSKFDRNIYAIKKGAPLVCGEKVTTKGNDLYVSSDPYALLGKVDHLYFPEDNVLCELNIEKNQLQFSELDLSPSKRFRKEVQSQDVEIAQKGQFPHFMLKEIYEQPALLTRLMQYYSQGEGKALLEKYKNKKFNYIYIIGCGTAWHAGLCIKEFLENFTQTRVSVELASEFRYRKPILSKNDLCLMISQSGETADTLACAQMAKEKGAYLLSIVNVQGSSLFRESHDNFLIKAGQEIGVASTKAFTLQVLTGFLLANSLGGNSLSTEIHAEFSLLEERIQTLLTKHDQIKKIAHALYQSKGFIFIGRGKYFPIALEGALKLKEIAYVHAEGYAAGELKHGPIALIDEAMTTVALLGPELFEKSFSNVEEIKARKGVIFAIAPEDHQEAQSVANYYLPLNFKGLQTFSSLYLNVVLQLFSYEVAKLKGTDIDRPRNLAKSVTVE
jgi:glucosamine--fructose-6-phosphate aminotransferase (isomerizing)